MEKKLHGIVTALLTPLHEDSSLDIDALEGLIENQITNGVNGIFIGGLTGEGAALPEETLLSLVRYSVRFVRGRVPLCAGAMANSTERVLHLARKIANVGADIISTTAPLAFCPSQDAIIKHFEFLTDRVETQWMVYGNAFSYPEIEPETFRRLTQIEGIIAVKDTRPDIQGAICNLIALEGAPAAYLSGGEYQIGPMFLLGADGNISGLASLYPKLFVQLYQSAIDGDAAKVINLSKVIAKFHSIMGNIGFWLAVFKAIGAQLNLMEPWCAQPCQPITNQKAYRKIDDLINQFSVWR